MLKFNNTKIIIKVISVHITVESAVPAVAMLYRGSVGSESIGGSSISDRSVRSTSSTTGASVVGASAAGVSAAQH